VLHEEPANARSGSASLELGDLRAGKVPCRDENVVFGSERQYLERLRDAPSCVIEQSDA
jgi:hypothetical protein